LTCLGCDFLLVGKIERFFKPGDKTDGYRKDEK